MNLAIDSETHYLVTGDKDLLELEKVHETKILTIMDLKKLMK